MRFDEFLGQALLDTLDGDTDAFQRAGGSVAPFPDREVECPDCLGLPESIGGCGRCGGTGATPEWAS